MYSKISQYTPFVAFFDDFIAEVEYQLPVLRCKILVRRLCWETVGKQHQKDAMHYSPTMSS
jgi:hypothetical protein